MYQPRQAPTLGWPFGRKNTNRLSVAVCKRHKHEDQSMVCQRRFTGVVMLHLTNVGECLRVYLSALSHLEEIAYIVRVVVVWNIK